jgi:hypothetical protein
MLMPASWLPQVQDAIRESVLRDLKDWFTSIKEGAVTIGKLALEMTQTRQEKADEFMSSKQSLIAESRSVNMGASLEMAMNEEYDRII